MSNDVKSDPTPPKRRPGRPRSQKARAAILKAAIELLEEAGPGMVTIERVAKRAGVGKPTVYRWWPDRHAVLMAALMDAAPDAEMVEEGGSPLEVPPLTALLLQLEAIAERFRQPTGRHVTLMLATADRDSELSKSFRHHFVMARRQEGRRWLEEARTGGHLRSDADLEVALDQLYGPVFFRLLMGHEPLDVTFVRTLLGQVVEGLRVRSPS